MVEEEVVVEEVAGIEDSLEEYSLSPEEVLDLPNVLYNRDHLRSHQ